jgi:site-specific recombinase XerC
MSRSKPESLLTLTQSFFHNYLQGTRGASAHTLRAYRDALKLFFLFLSDRKHKTVADLSLEDVQAETVLAFLDHIEAKRSNSAVTRNCRLAAVRSFVQHLLDTRRPVQPHPGDSDQAGDPQDGHLSRARGGPRRYRGHRSPFTVRRPRPRPAAVSL